MPSSRSLASEHPGRFDVPILAGVALVALVYSVQAPALMFENLGPDSRFSILTGILGFLESGNILLALLLLGFSVLFPVVKLVAILLLWFVPVSERRRHETVAWLEILGKWSLLDSFVIAVLIGTVQLGILSEARAEPGVFVYLGAILASLAATFLVNRVLGSRPTPAPDRRVLWLTIPAFGLYLAGLFAPLIRVEKGWFWENQFSLLDGIGKMIDAGEAMLAVVLALFVVVLPVARFLGLIALRLVSRPQSRWSRALRILDRWAMADVFVVALLVVFSKVGDLATAEPRAGLWLFLGAGILIVAESIWMHREVLRALPPED